MLVDLCLTKTKRFVPLQRNLSRGARLPRACLDSRGISFFVCLDVGTYAARKVMQSAHGADLDAMEAWIRRVAELRLGMAAFTRAAGREPCSNEEKKL